ncbi:element excision factor XisH family protein [Coleofasciculus sp.]|uniref:element excision factor XisH family protein n=1 Tax=Coleofasciculus sp. TaxID=3100458 RepID=UPI003A41731C
MIKSNLTGAKGDHVAYYRLVIRLIGQYVLYRLLLKQVDPERELYLAVADTTFDGIFSEPIGDLVMRELPMKLLIVDVEAVEVKRWIPPRESRTL